ELLRDLDALATVFESPRTHQSIRVADASEPVRVVAEEVRVDRADPDPALPRVVAERAPVVHPVPRNVKRDARAAAGDAMDERGVVDPVPDRSRRARPRVDVEARAGVAVAPRRGLDLERRELLEDGVLRHRA